MKKFLWLIVCLMTMVFTSCSTKYLVMANYEVCYPDGTRTYDGSAIVNSSTEPSVACYSYGGTNYISAMGTETKASSTTSSSGFTYVTANTIKKAEHIVSSTAPMRLNSYTIEKINNKGVPITKTKSKKNNDAIYMSDILSH